jgi:hypothetical protein
LRANDSASGLHQLEIRARQSPPHSTGFFQFPPPSLVPVRRFGSFRAIPLILLPTQRLPPTKQRQTLEPSIRH